MYMPSRYYKDIHTSEMLNPLDLSVKPALITDDWGIEDDKPLTLGQMPNKVAAALREQRKQEKEVYE